MHRSKGKWPCKSKTMRTDKKNHCIVLVGDGAVGKTSMILNYINNGYPGEYSQIAFDVFSGLVHVNGIPVRIKLMDTAGQEGFDRFCSLRYAQVDVFHPSSASALSTQHPSTTSSPNGSHISVPSIPPLPLFWLGLKSDLRHGVNTLINLDQSRIKPVGSSKAWKLAEKMRAQYYVERSALTQKNLKEVFECAVYAAIKHKTCKKAKKVQLLHRLKYFLLWRVEETYISSDT